MTETKKSVRLPTSVVPRLYRVSLTALTDLKDFKFFGSLDVALDVKAKGLTEITCHAVDLQIEAKEVTYTPDGEGSSPVACSGVSFDSGLETVTFSFASALAVGSGVLRVKQYVGELNNKMKGFYRTMYKLDGKDKVGAVTQFEATDARRCLPCWDEPAIKAEFEATVTAPKQETVISNMPVVEGYPKAGGEGLLVWKFGKTPKMSTYLLAFVVGEFDYIEANSQAARFENGKAVGDVAVRVYAPKGKTEQAQFGLDVAVKCLSYFTEFFEIGYPLPKLDLVAIPDFSSGAMENWGCVTYRTVCLLVDPKNTALKNKQYVAIVVAHELAHQWFGNLVTMEWWTELWLNEGFASWVEYLAVDKLFPDWKVWQSFVNDAHNPALGLDCLLTSHPIEVVVNHPSEIDEIFDTISYLKGAAVIRMLANYLGLDTFRKGLVRYLNHFKYSNATTVDLWRYLEIGGGLEAGTVSSLMTNWTAKMGYPVLQVEEAKDGGFEVSQQHFVGNGQKGHDTVWQVPVVMDLISDAKKKPTQTKTLVKSSSETIPCDTAYTAAVFNKSSQAYFIVKYGEKLMAKLKQGIAGGLITDPVDRLAIQSDLMAVVKAGVSDSASSKEYFELIKSFRDETEYIVWESILGNLAKLSTLAKAAGFQDSLSKYMVDLLTPIATKLGWDPKDGEPATDQMLRAQVIPLIGIHGHEATVEAALNKFDEFYGEGQYKDSFEGKPSLAADFRSGVYRIAVKQRGKKAFDNLMQIYKETSLQEEKVRILRSLGAKADEALLAETLNLSIDFKSVRKQDCMYAIYGSVGTDLGLRMTWDFLKKQWPRMLKEFKGTHMLVRLASVTSRFAKDEDYEDVKAFFDKNEHPGAERKVKQCLESIKTNANWLKRDQQKIAAAVGAL